MIKSNLKSVGFVIPPFNTFGGAERLIAEEIKYFQKEEGIQVNVLTEQVDSNLIEELNIPEEVSFYILKKGNFLRQVPNINHFINETEIDVIMSHHYDRSVYTGSLLHSLGKFSHIHGTAFWYKNHPGISTHLRKNSIKEIIENTSGHSEFHSKVKTTLPNISAYINESLKSIARSSFNDIFVDTYQVQEELRAMYDIDSTVIRPGVHQHWLNSYPNIKPVELSRAHYNLISVCRLDIRNRVDLTVKSFASLYKERKDIHLTICGIGEERKDLEQLVSALGLEDAVTFTGFIPDDDLARYYKAADVLSFPAWTPYGIVPLEAYGMGCKVVISSDAFAKEVLVGKPGVYESYPGRQQFASAIGRSLNSSEKPDRLSVPTWDEYCKRKAELIKKSL